MGAFDSDGNKIVATWPGRLTGETMYRTKDGRCWTSENIYWGTGQSRADIVGDRMVPRPYERDAPKPDPKPEPPRNRRERRAVAARSRRP